MTMTALECKTEIIELLEELGFPVYGISPPELSEESFELFKKWLSLDYEAEMNFMRTRKDADIGAKAVLPEVQSVIVIGLPYNHPRTSSENGPRGLVSLYASGRDYHRIFESRFKHIKKKLMSLGDSPRCYVDYGPVMERAYAVQAGLGFIGKNGSLINPEYGSYLFLGVILSTLELPFDDPIDMSCEKECDICFRACPTKALKEDNLVDSRKCISYHTIENRKTIPEDIREKMGQWILGCDMCQIICPFNKDVPNTLCEDIINTRIHNRCELLPFLEHDMTSFAEAYQGTAAMRPGFKVMKRNAAIAVANSNSVELIHHLKTALSYEESETLREHLKWAIEKLMSNNLLKT